MIARAAAVKTKVQNLCRRVMLDRAGNIAMTFAIVSIPLLGAMGASFDYIRALNLHREIQGNLDAALVAAVKDIGTKDENALKQQLANWLAAEATVAGSYTLDTNTVSIDKTNSVITAKVKANVNTTFMRILGKDTVPVAVQASVAGGQTVTKSAFSMYLVLDQSYSMSEYADDTKRDDSKMEALKAAVSTLLTTFNTADPNKKYVRTAAVSYNGEMQSPTAMEWGTKKVSKYVKKLEPDGITNSSGAMKKAYEILSPKTGAGSEDAIHKAMNGAEPVKYIVLMTDGENTKYEYNSRTRRDEIVDNTEADDATKLTCTEAKTAGIKIYAIAFKAPARGKALLDFCSSGNGFYYDVQNTSQIIDAFKSIGEQSANKLIRLTN